MPDQQLAGVRQSRPIAVQFQGLKGEGWPVQLTGIERLDRHAEHLGRLAGPV